jgi:2-polyprenyl-6-methoxyphenol hydroxylase-like FAD-dependent oxidoreductase
MGKVRDIAIVGGGTAGAASALFLSAAGHRVTLFERVDAPTAVGAGILLQPTGMHVLNRLGLLEDVLAHGARVNRLHGTNSRGRTVLDVRYCDWGVASFGLGLHRGVLFSLLWNALAVRGVGVRIASVDRVAQRADKVSAFSGDTLLGEFDCLVIADGSRSTLRGSLAIRQSTTPYPWGALWAIVPDDGSREGVLRQWFHRAQRMLGLMSTGSAYGEPAQPVSSLFWSLPAVQLDAWRSAGLQAWKKAVLELAPIASTLEHITSFDQLTFASYADVRMDRWHDRRVVCLGDAAHATSPQLGQGANLALVDAWVLARCFERGGEVGDILVAYSRRRKSHLRYYQSASRWLTPFFQSHSRVASTLRDLALGAVCRAPYAKGQMAKTLCGGKTGWLWGDFEAGQE